MGGAFTDFEDFCYLGYGVGGQTDMHWSFHRNSYRFSTVGLLYALTYEIEGPYRSFRKDISQVVEDSNHRNIDTSKNGLSSSMQLYAEWLTIHQESWDFFIRPFIGANLPGTPIPIVTESDKRFLSIYSAGLYWGIREENNCIFLKFEIDTLAALNVSVGTSF
jgi:hypothetical protein